MADQSGKRNSVLPGHLSQYEVDLSQVGRRGRSTASAGRGSPRIQGPVIVNHTEGEPLQNSASDDLLQISGNNSEVQGNGTNGVISIPDGISDENDRGRVPVSDVMVGEQEPLNLWREMYGIHQATQYK